MPTINEFAAISIRMASPDRVREWSHGEVKKPETINYRTLKPELEGLFCERIFGSTKDWECYCGKFKSIRYRGVVCDRCQVEVTHSKVRRDRMGHIDLVAPVSHIWYFKGIPSKMGILLGMTLKELDRVLYFQSYIILGPGDTPLKKKQLLTEEQHQDMVSKYGNRFRSGMGAEAVRELLTEIDLPQMKHEINESLKMKQSKQDERQLIRQLDVVQSFIASNNRPEWMILAVLPVLPPELRPMVQLDGGRFATSDLNDLYRRVLNRNNRLRRLVELKAPGIIVRNEKRMLQEAVDALLDNGRRGRPVKGASNNRVLKSLSDMLKGKQGRFRQNLLGKRVDYSGRSVIVIGPELKLHQCGLPKKMALELFKPFIMRVLVQRGLASNIKAAKKMVERAAPEVWEVIEDVIADHPVLLNRAPTLHRLGIQAFQPVLIEGKAIRVHPLVCVAFNADFDGDQMAVHVPLSTEAIVECKMLMMADRNILSPASGKPVITPTQDIVLGIYYLTKERESAANLHRVFADEEECLYALETGVIDLQGRVRIRLSRLSAGETKRRVVETTPGRIIFNSVMPDGYEFVNRPLGKPQMGVLFNDLYNKYGETITGQTADRVKTIGFDYATRAGISIGIDDMRVPNQKDQLVQISKDEVQKINDQYDKGVITEQERYTKIIDLWTNTTDEVAKVMFDEIEADREGFNPIYIMADSGARGSKAQIKQLAGMRGLMADPLGKIRETPITSNFREGLSVIEFFQSTTGARKGLTDTALKTANAGYLTRRLVDVSQDVVVNEEDCGTPEGIPIAHLKTGEEIIESVGRRSLGRFLAEDVEDPRTEGKFLLAAGAYIDEAAIKELDGCGVEELKIRSVLTCQSLKGVCRKCYGRDLGTGRMVEIGEAVGVIAAQSIGEPGTQLTLRTFHVGGTASADDTYLRARFSGEITALPSGKIQADGTFLVTEEGDFKGRRIERIEIVPKTILEYVNSRGSSLTQPLKTGLTVDVVVKDGATVKADEDLVRIEVRMSEAGKVRTVKKDSVVIAVTGKKERRIDIPTGLKILVAENEKVPAGAVLALRSFHAPYAGRVTIAARKDGGETVTLTATVEENLSSVAEKGKLVEAAAMVGAEPRVKIGACVELSDIIGMNPSFAPHFATLDGRVEFERIAIQKEGNEQIVIKPEGLEGDEQGIMVIWKGAEHLIGPSDDLLVQHGELVEPGKAITKTIKAAARGVLHVVRRYHTKDGKAVQVVRLVEAGDKRTLPYLRYTRTTAGTAKSKTLSKVKKQNIKLISKCHVVRFDLFRKVESVTAGMKRLLEDLKALEHAPTFRSDLFSTAEFVVPSQKALQDIYSFEEKSLEQKVGLTAEKGELIVKQFSDFLRGPKEGGAEKSGMTKDITGGLPRVEELFELRKPKSTPAPLSPVDGRLILGAKFKKENIAVVKAVDGTEHELEIPAERHLIVEDGDEVTAGELLTDGPVDIHELLKVRSETVVQQYIVNEVQDVYRMQGVEINDKHIEVIVRQMMRKVQIETRGESEFLPGQLVDRIRLAADNRRLEAEGKAPSSYKPVLLGITKSAKHSDSFISAASFQETTWALTNAAIQGKRDDLRGLKEAVIIGHLIPAGTGLKRYRDDVLVEHASPDTDGEPVILPPETPSAP